MACSVRVSQLPHLISCHPLPHSPFFEKLIHRILLHILPPPPPVPTSRSVEVGSHNFKPSVRTYLHTISLSPRKQPQISGILIRRFPVGVIWRIYILLVLILIPVVAVLTVAVAPGCGCRQPRNVGDRLRLMKENENIAGGGVKVRVILSNATHTHCNRSHSEPTCRRWYVVSFAVYICELVGMLR